MQSLLKEFETYKSSSKKIKQPRGEALRAGFKKARETVEDIMGIGVPSRSERNQKMYEAAQKYYALLHKAGAASAEEKEALKAELDELSAPFSDNVAYYAFLEMERMAAGMGKSSRAVQSIDA
ncbi:hypothetical protein [Endozoicomonas sp. ONNA2]|uniref:hypothetical protein n=1 Tax=Endozoicomonas sp. ONNA2 TaxID=2828741 RepID=UPI0021476FBD|nr:hypothetical protein [Endozoicomonas sp. ONNA2]